MICQTPITIRNKADPKKLEVVPCGKCVYCCQRRQREWSVRLKQELKNSTNAVFLTLTLADENLIYTDCDKATLSKRHLQLFMKRLRKGVSGKFVYYAVGEYGSKTKRPHYHMILFNCPENDYQKYWQLGHVHQGTVTGASISYTLKYMMKQLDFSEYYDYKSTEGILSPFALMSKGIGRSYIDERRKWHKQEITRNHVVTEGGIKTNLPRYYREKIYSKLERDIQNRLNRDRLEASLDLERIKEDARIFYERIRRDENRVINNSKRKKL